MKGKRRAHSDKFKAKIAIEAIKGIKTLSELATEYKIHPNQISTWKKQLQMNAAELFTHGKKSKAKSGQREPNLPSAHRTVCTGPYTAPHVTLIQ